LALVAARPDAARAEDPMAVVRAFCRADGEGARLRARSWRRIAALVAWPLEPAWDRVVLISGYQLSTPRGNGDAVEMDVEFTVTGEIRPGRILTVQRLDPVTFTLVRDPHGDRWRILGPPYPPHVFTSNVDPHAMAVLLAPESDAYQSASALVWRTLRKSGRDVSYAETEKLGSTTELEAAGEAVPGAVALYYDGEKPYHAGIVDADEAITSATLNAGVVTLPADAFPGEIRYRRVAPGPESQTPEPKGTGAAPP
jgi:hypothetical protein